MEQIKNTDDLETVIKYFKNKPKYIRWLKEIYQEGVDINTLRYIANMLSSYNIKCFFRGKEIIKYSRNEINTLLTKLQAIKRCIVIKKVIMEFNTFQRKMLFDFYNIKQLNLNDYSSNFEILYLYSIFNRFDLLECNDDKKRFISECSAIKSANELIDAIKDYITSDLRNIEKNSFSEVLNRMDKKEYELIWNNEEIYLIKIKSFIASKIIGGYGKTNWCISHHEYSWKDYITEGKEQYFVIDFRKGVPIEYTMFGFTTINPNALIGKIICYAYDRNDRDITGKEINRMIKSALPTDAILKLNIESLK